MSALDRVMRAYVSRHDLTYKQTEFVRSELSKIIEEFSMRPRGSAMAPPTGENDAPGAATAEEGASAGDPPVATKRD